MPRRNGSYFGLTVNPTPSVASGIWRVREAEEFLRVNKWPATPGVPGSPVGVSGNTQVSLSWSAPSLGLPPTDYQVQYSSNSGTTWTTFSDSTSTATSAVVTGLTNGTGYIFRVRAVNALGEGPYGAASGAVTPSALNLLLHFNGSNGSTTFTDSSGYGNTLTAHGNAQLSTAEYKFGTASGYFDGDSDYVSVAGSVAQFGTGDFTVDFWAFPLSLNTYTVFTGNFTSSPSGNKWQLLMNGSGELDYYDDSASFAGVSVPVVTGQWQHIALVRHGGQLTIYLDGVSYGTASNSYDLSSTQDLWIGRAPESEPNRWFDGYIDEYRIVKGTAFWTANFTPPSSPY